MRLLFVADARSPIARQWIWYFVQAGEEVHLVSTFAAAPLAGLKSFEILPVAFSGAKPASGAGSRRGVVWGASALGLRTALRHWLGPLTIPPAARRLRQIAQRVQPHLVHALRIPYEGMLAASAGLDVPLLLSVWGNDFTLHAPSTPLMAGFTRRALAAASALHADCERDVRLARRWGFAASSPSLVLPGNGGIRADVFSPAPSPANLPIVINPRGFRAYVRNDVFFESIPLVQRERPDARFVCASMAEEPRAAEMVKRLGVQAITHFLPPLPHESMAEQFQKAQVLVSPATHDGTPNTLLEGMACGCLPVAGDLESIREWITDGQNGLLVNPADPSALANAILRGLNDPLLRAQAARQNAHLIQTRASYTANMPAAQEFYRQMSLTKR